MTAETKPKSWHKTISDNRFSSFEENNLKNLRVFLKTIPLFTKEFSLL